MLANRKSLTRLKGEEFKAVAAGPTRRCYEKDELRSKLKSHGAAWPFLDTRRVQFLFFAILSPYVDRA